MNGDDREDGREELGEDEVPDVEVTTSVRVSELRFGIVPETRSWCDGEPGVRSSSETERQNLPDAVESGVTYRDVEVRWRARARIVHPTDPDSG